MLILSLKSLCLARKNGYICSPFFGRKTGREAFPVLIWDEKSLKPLVSDRIIQ